MKLSEPLDERKIGDGIDPCFDSYIPGFVPHLLSALILLIHVVFCECTRVAGS